MQVALQKKQLAVSFVQHFKHNHENITCVNFQFDNPKLSQKKVFHPLCLLYRAI